MLTLFFLSICRLAVLEVTSLLLAALSMLGQVEVTQSAGTCSMDSPAQGICGDRLVQALDNLCLLLTLFESQSDSGMGRLKRSPFFQHIRRQQMMANLDRYPLDAFVRMDLVGESVINITIKLAFNCLEQRSKGTKCSPE